MEKGDPILGNYRHSIPASGRHDPVLEENAFPAQQEGSLKRNARFAITWCVEFGRTTLTRRLLSTLIWVVSIFTLAVIVPAIYDDSVSADCVEFDGSGRASVETKCAGGPDEGDASSSYPWKAATRAEAATWVGLHISDTHVTRHTSVPGDNLRDILGEFAPAVNPTAVIASGDLTDGKTDSSLTFRGGVFQEDWEEYKTIVEETGFWDAERFFDIRGNHDVFGVVSVDNDNNLFREYGVQGESSHADGHNYVKTLDLGFGVYSLVGMDMVMAPGPPSPMGFFTPLTERMLNNVESFMSQGDALGTNGMLAFSHFPYSTMTTHGQTSSSGKTFQDIMGEFTPTAYFCGHYHLPDMVTRRKLMGYHELEVADAKRLRAVRVFAYDHDLFSFVDTDADAEAVILPTNPPNAEWAEGGQPLARTRASTHIRVLIFSHLNTIGSASCEIEGKTYHLNDDGENMWTAPWDPQGLPEGVMEMVVTARLENGDEVEYTQKFSVDGSAVGLGFSQAQFQQRMDYQLFFGLLVALQVIYILGWKLIAPLVWRWYLKRNGTYDEWLKRVSALVEVEITRNIGASDLTLADTIALPNALTTVSLWDRTVWGFHRSLWEYGLLEQSFAGWYSAFGVLSVVSFPMVVGPWGDGEWGVMYLWGLTYGGETYVDISVTMLFLGFAWVVVMPSLSFVVYARSFHIRRRIQFLYKFLYTNRHTQGHNAIKVELGEAASNHTNGARPILRTTESDERVDVGGGGLAGGAASQAESLASAPSARAFPPAFSSECPPPPSDAAFVVKSPAATLLGMALLLLLTLGVAFTFLILVCFPVRGWFLSPLLYFTLVFSALPIFITRKSLRVQRILQVRVEEGLSLLGTALDHVAPRDILRATWTERLQGPAAMEVPNTTEES